MRLAAIRALMAHPLARGRDLDDPTTSALRRRIIREKPFLRRVYEEWYADIAAALNDGPEFVLELGSGGGFLRDRVPRVLASDIMVLPGLSLVSDATALPFRDATLRAIVMVNVLHHVADPAAFFREAARVVLPRGRIVMLEPWMTAWSNIVYSRMHHEPCDRTTPSWRLMHGGPLTAANSALPWIIFERDRAQFASRFPEWSVDAIRLGMPFRYLLSGGVAQRGLMPGFTFGWWRWLEARLDRWAPSLAMFARIVLVRQ